MFLPKHHQSCCHSPAQVTCNATTPNPRLSTSEHMKTNASVCLLKMFGSARKSPKEGDAAPWASLEALLGEFRCRADPKLRGQQRKLLPACGSHISAMTSLFTATFHFFEKPKLDIIFALCTFHYYLRNTKNSTGSYKRNHPLLTTQSHPGAPSHVFAAKHTPNSSADLQWASFSEGKARPNDT